MPIIAPRAIPVDAANQLQAQGYSSALARIFAARGITDAAQLDTSFAGLLPFDNMKNIKHMACLLADAIAARKKLLVIADYDADGATACTVAVRGLRSMGALIDFIVPNRFEYGYGLTPEIVQLAAQYHPDILLTVDNGIASVDGVATANQLGIQVFVTDHHLPGDTLPDATCIVNPNQPGCEFASKNLAGVGVIFYVLLALRAELRQRGAFGQVAEPKLAELLDLVALGTVADVVKLDHNNRILVQQGLQRIRAGKSCAGILALLQIAKKPAKQVSSQDLGFTVGPRLNAAGRLDDMSLGINCLLCDDATQALIMAAELDSLNRERRNIEADMQETAQQTLKHINSNNDFSSEQFSLVLFDDSWHQGVIGILASRLKDQFHRPVIIFAAHHDDELKGSGRSINALHLRDALDLVSKRRPDIIKKFGGHSAAAGLTIHADKLADFTQTFNQVCQDMLDTEDLAQRIETDGSLAQQDMRLDTAQLLEQQVWGQGFPAPQFNNAFCVLNQRVVGEKHLKLQLRHPHDNSAIDAMLFGQHEFLPEQIDAVYTLNINEYRGNTSLQLFIRHWVAAS